MKPDLRARYLEAIGIPVWVQRDVASEPVPSAPGLHLGPGEGACLLVSADAMQSASQTATDIARCLPGSPVWAWPTDEAGAPSVEDAVNERLFTSVLIFGVSLAGELGVELPGEIRGSAKVRIVAGLEELASSGEQRRGCWQTLKEMGAVPLGDG